MRRIPIDHRRCSLQVKTKAIRDSEDIAGFLEVFPLAATFRRLARCGLAVQTGISDYLCSDGLLSAEHLLVQSRVPGKADNLEIK